MTTNTPNALQTQTPQNDSEQQPAGGIVSRSLIGVVLIFIESAIALMLRLDPKLRQLAYPLAKAGTVVCIRSYLPHTTIYATFGYRGVLLDSQLPANVNAEITVNAYSFQLVNALINHSPSHIESLQIRGEAVMVENFKAFLLRVGVGGAIQNLITKFTGNQKPKPTAESQAKQNSDYQQKIAEQAERIDTLSTENKRLSIQLAELASKQKSTFVAMIVAAFAAIVSTVLHFFI
ncbi:hypothetical protein SAMN02745664_1089 [Moraxella cuniculi DSM 21768]|uniref:Uncharacterized protein n=1 Tax=Moraxella cuniculi DSM 21768 TaxID=1122245 RepID=A0A1N7EWM8_9GAMM|nr:hypothetical protein [Moraxella cuniculi]SIR92493.1 hypothetical protein SAMN02745664_1089 [Moraxella cuniculi DSM 21768]